MKTPPQHRRARVRAHVLRALVFVGLFFSWTGADHPWLRICTPDGQSFVELAWSLCPHLKTEPTSQRVSSSSSESDTHRGTRCCAYPSDVSSRTASKVLQVRDTDGAVLAAAATWSDVLDLRSIDGARAHWTPKIIFSPAPRLAQLSSFRC